jgi:glycosyltransferase involved in cell wall biosynthesis
LICTPSFSTTGGVERILESLHHGLPERGFEVVFGLARGSRFHDPARYREAFPGFQAVEIDGRTGTRVGRLRGLRRVLREVRPDLVLIARLFDAYEAVCESKLAGSPVRLAVTIQGYEPEYFTDLAVYQDFVDLCVASGNLVHQAVRRFTNLPEELSVNIPGGAARPVRPQVPRRADGPLRLGYVGRLEQEQKRVLDLVEILAGLVRAGVPFTCTIAGSGPVEGELRLRLAEANLDHHVRFLGWLSTEQLYEAVYPHLDVVLHCAAWEGVTIAPREAMAHGVVPVMSRFVGCLSEGLFRDGVTGLLFDVGDAAAATACILRLHQDRGLLDHLADGARLAQQGVYCTEGAVEAWSAAFHETLARPGRTGSRLPSLPFPPSGRLERWGLARDWAEVLRAVLGRRFAHNDPGSEWPHWSGLAQPDLFAEIARFAREEEARHRHEPVASA